MLFQFTWRAIYNRRKTQTARPPKHNTLALDVHGNPGAIDSPFFDQMGPIQVVINEHSGHTAYETGQHHVVQPGRGKRAVWINPLGDLVYDPLETAGHLAQVVYSPLEWVDARHTLARAGYRPLEIVIRAIRLQDVRTYTPDDYAREGFAGQADFLNVWTDLYDRIARFHFDPQRLNYHINTGKRREGVSYETVQAIIQARPAERYTAWVLTFEVVDHA